MTTLMLDIPPDLYGQIQREAERVGQPIEVVISSWLAKHVQDEVIHADVPVHAPPDERDQARALLRAADLLVELGPTLQQRAKQSTASLEDVQAAFARVGGKPLSEIVIENRGSKD